MAFKSVTPGADEGAQFGFARTLRHAFHTAIGAWMEGWGS